MYRTAQLYQGDSEWYIFYYYRNAISGLFERFKERFNMNRIKNKTERLQYARRCLKFINQKLKEGFNPFTVVKATELNSGAIKNQLEELIKLIITERAKATPTKYKQTYNRFCKFLEKRGLFETSMHQYTLSEVKDFQKWMLAEKFSTKTINSTTNYMAIFWDEAIERKIVESNPFRQIKQVRNAPGDSNEDIYEPLSTKELETVFGYLIKNDPGFLRYLYFIYYAWARPKEITKLKVSDIDTVHNTITFRKLDTKSQKRATVQIVPPLLKVLSEMNLNKCNQNQYLFSGPDFMPGDVKKDSNKLGQRWKAIVQDHLGISKLMYALKHSGNIHYLLNNKGNVDLKWQQMQNRHSSAAMTEKYNRALGAYFIDLKEVKFTEFNHAPA